MLPRRFLADINVRGTIGSQTESAKGVYTSQRRRRTPDPRFPRLGSGWDAVTPPGHTSQIAQTPYTRAASFTEAG